MKSKSAVPLLLLLGGVAVLGYGGCGTNSFPFGTSADSHTPDFDTIPSWRVASIERGKDITLTKKNGEKLKGEYLGLDTIAASQYAQWYNESREKYERDVLLPALGDSITYTFLDRAQEYNGEFLGFDDQYICVRLMGAFRIITAKIDMNTLERITDKNGHLIEVGKLKNLSSEGKIPALSAVRVTVKTDSDTLHVPMAAVARIAVPSEAGVRDGKRKGFILGGGIGMGLTSYTYEENHNSVYYRRSSSKSESKATVLTDVKIGYAPSELVQVYLMSRVAWLSWEGDLTASGVHGLGVTYFFEPEAPSWFLTAGLGISTWEKVVLVQLGGGGRVTWYGFGLTMGAGYEFAPHSSVEGRVTWGNPNTGSDYFQESLNTLSLGVTVNFRRY